LQPSQLIFKKEITMKPINFSNPSNPISETKPPNVSLHALVLGLALAGCSVEALAATTYTFTDLTKITAPGFLALNLGATSINNSGVIVGRNVTGGFPVVYDAVAGTATIASPLGGVTRINALGQALGATFVSTRPPLSVAAVRNPDGTSTRITVSPTDTNSYPIDINDKGQVLFKNNLPVCNNGSTCDFTNQSTYYYPQYLWSAVGGVQMLPKTGYLGQATSINNNGQVSGGTGGLPGATEHAFVATLTSLKDLHPKNVGPSSIAFKINDAGWAVGRTSLVNGDFHATLWNTATGAYTDVGTANNLSVLSDINTSGQVIGWEGTGGYTNLMGNYAVVGDANGITDLNTLVSGLPANLKLYDAIDINDAGQILVKAYDVTTNADYGALLLNPNTPPPAACSGSGTITNYPVSKVFLQLTDGTKVGFTATAAGTTFTGGTTTFANGEVITYTGTLDTATTICAATTMTVAPATVVTPPAATAPAAPSNLVSSVITRNQVVLSWADNASNELNYLIERCKGASCTGFSQVTSVGANVTTYSNTGLRANSSYSYRVRATNATGKSAYSNTLSIKTLP
jgi:Fibronectin type III domain